MVDVLAHPTPLTEQVRIGEISEHGDELHVLAAVTVDPHNPILAGHYPGMPIFPGVCLIECAHHAVLLAARRKGLGPTLESISSARFLDAVLPGDSLTIDVRITRGNSTWAAAARLRNHHALAAKVSLRYGLPEGAECTG